jgi:hypothetical protein
VVNPKSFEAFRPFGKLTQVFWGAGEMIIFDPFLRYTRIRGHDHFVHFTAVFIMGLCRLAEGKWFPEPRIIQVRTWLSDLVLKQWWLGDPSFKEPPTCKKSLLLLITLKHQWIIINTPSIPIKVLKSLTWKIADYFWDYHGIHVKQCHTFTTY